MSKTTANRVPLNWGAFDHNGYRYETQGTALISGRRKVEVNVYEQNDQGDYEFERKVRVIVGNQAASIELNKLVDLVWKRIDEIDRDDP